MSDDELDEAERRCIEMIELIRRDFEKAAKPYIDRLAFIRSLRRPTMVIPADQVPSCVLDATR